LHLAPTARGLARASTPSGVELIHLGCALRSDRHAGRLAGAHRHGQLAILALHQQRHMHRQQLAHFIGQRLVERESPSTPSQ
jgi:hypothetical protein